MMKTPISLLFLLLAILPWSLAQQSQQSALLSAIAELPPCALKCLTTAIAQSPCELTDQKCICTNAKLQSGVEACVLQSCTVKQGLSTKNITMTTCGAPIRDRSHNLRVLNIVLGVMSAVCVALRITYKAIVTVYELGLDDYFILITLISGVPSTIIQDRGTLRYGLGKDIWTLPFGEITDFVKWFYVMEVFYFVLVALLKLSLLFFYHRIFPGIPVRRVITATIIFDILFGFAFTVTAIFQCRPVRFYWESWDGEHTGKCIDINALAWANAAISIALDIWMLAIPLSQLVHLKLAWKKKVGVALMFCVGTFVTVVSIIRLQSLIHFSNSTNPTWDQFDVASWSTIEINVGIICTCMPAIRVILVRLFPKVLGSTRPSGQNYASYGNRSGHLGKTPEGSKSLSTTLRNDRSVITYTKTFEVQHADNDEVGLVEMDDLSGKGAKVKSGNSSQVSL